MKGEDKNIVLVHGWGASSDKLEDLRIELINKNWKVLNMKLPGFDLPSPKRVWNLDNYVDFVLKETVKAFGKKEVIIFGHSFGGRIAIKIASRNKNKIKGIVLCSSGGLSRPGFVKRYVFKNISKIFNFFLNFIPIKHYKTFRKMAYKILGGQDYGELEGNFRLTFINIINEPLNKLIGKINVPILILWGDMDRTTPVKDAFFLKNNLYKSKIKIFKQRTHNLPYVEHVLVAKEINKWFKTIV
jgi:pimeloyl-ACP methyl ester carboxylesterase